MMTKLGDQGYQAQIAALERTILPLKARDRNRLLERAEHLKSLESIDEIGWVIGVVVERVLVYFYGMDWWKEN